MLKNYHKGINLAHTKNNVAPQNPRLHPKKHTVTQPNILDFNFTLTSTLGCEKRSPSKVSLGFSRVGRSVGFSSTVERSCLLITKPVFSSSICNWTCGICCSTDCSRTCGERGGDQWRKWYLSVYP